MSSFNWKHELCVAIVAEWVYHYYAYDLPTEDGGLTRRSACVVHVFRNDVEELLGGPITWVPQYLVLPNRRVLRAEVSYHPLLGKSVTRLRRFSLSNTKKEK